MADKHSFIFISWREQ